MPYPKPRLPGRSKFEELFKSGKSVWLKMLGGALAGGAASCIAIFRAHGQNVGKEGTEHFEIFFVIGATALGAIVAAALSLKDVVRGRIAEGSKVNPILKLYFGMGCATMAVWGVTAIFILVALIYIYSAFL